MAECKPKIGVDAVDCRKCSRRAEGTLLADALDMGGVLPMYHYDREREVLQINEDLLLYAIRLVNPLQPPRELELARLTPAGYWVPTARRIKHVKPE